VVAVPGFEPGTYRV